MDTTPFFSGAKRWKFFDMKEILKKKEVVTVTASLIFSKNRRKGKGHP
jgi:hypothetical protein